MKVQISVSYFKDKKVKTNVYEHEIELLPSYAFVLNSLDENKPITKNEFIELFKNTFDTVAVHRNNLFLYAIKDSKFETIKRKDGCAIFNE